MSHTHPLAATALAALLALGVAPTAHAQRIVIDAQTGQTRAPTADEVKTIDARTARGAAPPVGLTTGRINPEPEVQRNGAIAHELDTSTLMYSVARRNADGSVSQYCVSGAEAAEALVKAKPARAGNAKVISKVGQEQTYEVK